MNVTSSIGRRLAIGTSGVVVIAATSFGIVRAASGTPNAPIAGLPLPNDPQIHTCIAAREVCNPAAEATFVASNPLAQPPSANPAYISRQAAEMRARAASRTALTAAAPAAVVAYSALMSRSAFESIYPGSKNATINPERKVWVITVHAPMATDGSPGQAPQIKDVYSFAIDAETGHWTDGCIGCALLQQSQ